MNPIWKRAFLPLISKTSGGMIMVFYTIRIIIWRSSFLVEAIHGTRDAVQRHWNSSFVDLMVAAQSPSLRRLLNRHAPWDSKSWWSDRDAKKKGSERGALRKSCKHQPQHFCCMKIDEYINEIPTDLWFAILKKSLADFEWIIDIVGVKLPIAGTHEEMKSCQRFRCVDLVSKI